MKNFINILAFCAALVLTAYAGLVFADTVPQAFTDMGHGAIESMDGRN